VSDGAAGCRRGDGTRPTGEALVGRLATALVHREPGWRLPKHSVLARRYGVSAAEIDAALGELAARRLIRRRPDGQLYRASPVECLIALEGVPGLGRPVDPMGGQFTCVGRQASLGEAPADVNRVLRLFPEEKVGVIRTQWATAHGEPAACCATYLLSDLAAPFLAGEGSGTVASLASLLVPFPAAAPDAIAEPGAVRLETRPPGPAIAERLRLAPGEPAVLVTTRFDAPRFDHPGFDGPSSEGPEGHRPVGLAVAALRPELFRVAVRAAGWPPAENGAVRLA
jgi:DNA-binding GntR family transcriptional regulator